MRGRLPGSVEVAFGTAMVFCRGDPPRSPGAEPEPGLFQDQDDPLTLGAVALLGRRMRPGPAPA